MGRSFSGACRFFFANQGCRATLGCLHDKRTTQDSGRYTWRGVRKSNFSPDGKYLAFVTYPRDMVSHSTSRIYVVPVAGGEPRLVYESMPWVVGSSFLSFLDWTGDGRFLAIKDVRNGRSALYLLPLRDGAPSGG